MNTRGRLLVASPALEDPSFRFAVVFMLEHGDEGALGLVLTQPSELPLGEMFDEWSARAAKPAVVHRGGPVSPSSVIALGVASPSDAAGFNEIANEIGTIDLDTAPSDIDSLRGIRAFAGYAGWTAGQLEAELLDDAWLVVDARPDDILHRDPPVLWWEVVGRQSGDTAKLRHYPEEPWLN